MLRTMYCGDVRPAHLGQEITLAGCVHRRRDHGGLVFIDLRDREGLVQVVFNPATSPDAHQVAEKLRNEYVLQVEGEVARRPQGTENLKLATGEIEVLVHRAKILNAAQTPPFYINEDVEVDESLRLKYRYLDIRRARMKDNLILRHKVVKFIRDFLDARGFIEVETPILIKSTPEGARDYLVPSRINPGQFYALPQSPQQLKQLLMVAGIDKYFQIARCFRDEDLRADRQPEFTQLDLEMSFVEEEDILVLLEDMFTEMMAAVKPEMRIINPFPRLSYRECMERFGTDKPDIRFGLELRSITDLVAGSEFTPFRSAVEEKGLVAGICIPGGASYSRRQLEEITEIAKAHGAKGLVTMALGEAGGSLEPLTMDKVRSIAAKFLTLEQISGMARRFQAQAGDLLLIAAGKTDTTQKILSQLRQEMGHRLNLADPNLFAYAFILNFPLLEWDKEAGHWGPTHHPFTAPVEEDIPLLDTEPEKVRARHYDIVCNGYELSSGSIRIHQRELQEKIFRLLGYRDDEIQERFGHLLEAFGYGAPPHGGIAPGIDRLVMLLAGEQNIREVIAFPKNQNAVDLLTNAPSPVSEAQLRELHLRLADNVNPYAPSSPGPQGEAHGP